MRRPPEPMSRLATCLARTIGSCSITRQMPLPILILLVAAAAIVSATKRSIVWEYSRGSSAAKGIRCATGRRMVRPSPTDSRVGSARCRRRRPRHDLRVGRNARPRRRQHHNASQNASGRPVGLLGARSLACCRAPPLREQRWIRHGAPHALSWGAENALDVNLAIRRGRHRRRTDGVVAGCAHDLSPLVRARN